MDISSLRNEIDSINSEILELFIKRMKVSANIAAYKRENGLPIFDAERERNLLANIREKAGEDWGAYSGVLFSLLMELSRSYQNKLNMPESKYNAIIAKAIDSTDKIFPERAIVACQGAEGAYSQFAAEKFFSLPSIMYMSSFDSVFAAVESGLCKYGILPLENSTAGSVNHIYDLMIKHNFYIVRSLRLQVNHVLLSKHGVKIEDIKEIISHEQALDQCSDFLRAHPGIKTRIYENTALAAKAVAESNDPSIAAISSSGCAGLYGLSILDDDIKNESGNYTRFICISKLPEVYPGADRTSMMMVIPHRPGSLYRIISRFYALGINLTKIESRPIPGHDFEFAFYFDVNASVYSAALAQLICELENETQQFKYLGSYSEII